MLLDACIFIDSLCFIDHLASLLVTWFPVFVIWLPIGDLMSYLCLAFFSGDCASLLVLWLPIAELAYCWLFDFYIGDLASLLVIWLP